MDTIKVVLIDDHNALRQSMRKAISEDEQIDVIASFSDALSAKSKIGELMPNVVLMDVVMPKIDGLQFTAWIKMYYKEIKVVIFTMHDREDYIRQALELGVSGYVVKDSFLENVIFAIKSAYKNQLYLSPSIAKKVIEQPQKWSRLKKKEFGLDLLTLREKDVLKLIAEGYRVREASDILNISVRTAETHRKNIMEKLGIHNSVQLTRYAIKNRLIDA